MTHFLLAGDSRDLATLETMVQRLPVDAYGQVFVEVVAPIQIRPWSAPPGVAVTWLTRGTSATGFAQVQPRGELIARAVEAWLAEWIPNDAPEQERPFVMWVGCAANARVNAVCRALTTRLESPHIHRSDSSR